MCASLMTSTSGYSKCRRGLSGQRIGASGVRWKIVRAQVERLSARTLRTRRWKEALLSAAPGLSARNGLKLTADSKYSVRTAPMPPSYYFASNGMVLPARQNGGLPIVTVNVAEVDIQFLRVKN